MQSGGNMRNLLFLLTLTAILAANEYEPSVLIKSAKSLEKSDPVKAIELYERAYFVRYPSKTDEDAVTKGFQSACKTALKNKNFEQVKTFVEKATAMSLPQPESFLYYLMLASHDKGDYNRCIDYATELLRKDEKDDDALFYRGKSRSKLKNYKKAIEDLTKISSKFDVVGRRSALILLGESYYHGGNFEMALQTLAKAQQLEPTEDIKSFITKVTNDKALEEGYISSKPSPHFIIRSAKDKQTELIDQLIPILERSYRSLIQIFQFFPDTPITVIVYDPKKRSMSVRIGNPSWAAGVYDGEIRIPYVETLKKEYDLETLLRHELTHLFIDVLTNNSAPTWFNEGIAQYYEKPFIYEGENTFSNYLDAPISELFKGTVSNAISKNKSMSYDQISSGFSSLSKDNAVLAYSQSLLMVKHLLESHGIWRVRRMFRDTYQGNNFDVAFNTEFGYRPQDFLKGWIIHQKHEWKLP